MRKIKLTHIQIISMGYLLIIIAGALLLMLPFSARSGDSAGFVNALFTSVSASCVTGLVIQDTVTYWSVFGQIIILVLIQLGGLGFMTVVTFFFKLLKHRTGIRERMLMAESINTTRLDDFAKLTKKIVAGTAFFEITGAVLLSLRFIFKYGFSPLKGIYYGIFHSVSAFCNAGFDLFGIRGKYSSLTTLYSDIYVNTIIMVLITAGGIGFLVWDDITVNKFRFKRFALHSKIVIIASLSLVLGGAALLLLFERNATISAMPWGEKITVSLFGSVTARTAGFNTVDTAALTPASKLLTSVLMFIGGSSGSTAGGVKTTTAALLIIYISSIIRGREATHCLNRRIKPEDINKAIVVFSVNLSLALTGVLVLTAVQGFPLEDAVFEAFSAIGTVGMSTGITRDLNLLSKSVIMFLMYCGRVGSVSFAIALFDRRKKAPVSYPTESVTVG